MNSNVTHLPGAAASPRRPGRPLRRGAVLVVVIALGLGCGGPSTDECEGTACGQEPMAECVGSDQCTDPARPICEDRRCVGCADPDDCTSAAPVCDPGRDECVGCESPSDCTAYADAPICASDGRCVGCETSADCSAGAMACDEESRTCRTCASHGECGSGACDLVEGTCVEESAVLFMRPSGVGTTCTRNLRCSSLAAAAAAATPERFVVRVAPGTYTGTTSLTGASLRIFADAGAVLRPTPGASATLEVVGASEVLLHGLAISGARIDSAGGAVRCEGKGGVTSLRILDSTIEDSSGHGVAASRCALLVERSTIGANRAGGIHSTGDQVATTIRASTIHQNLGIGISVTGVKAELLVEQSTIRENRDGGIFTSDAVVALVNNFIVGNGDLLSAIGGADVESATVEHNTLTGNVAEDGAAAGLTASGLCRNNIIFGNRDTAPDNGTLQVAGGCSHTFSLIGPEPEAGEGNQLGPPVFVDVSSGDHHLAPGSPGVDDGAPSSVAVDVDGDQRPLGEAPDMGADEVPPR